MDLSCPTLPAFPIWWYYSWPSDTTRGSPLEQNASDDSKPLISISTNQFALGMVAAYALFSAIVLVCVMGLFIFAGLLGVFFGRAADPTANPAAAMIGAGIICVILFPGVLLMIWGAESLLRRKPWQTGVFFSFLCCYLFLLFRAGPPKGMVLMSALAFLSAILLVVRWKRVFIQRRD